jgi:hypothetical protein
MITLTTIEIGIQGRDKIDEGTRTVYALFGLAQVIVDEIEEREGGKDCLDKFSGQES